MPLGFDVLADEGFAAMVLARIVEPTSKAEVVRVLDEIGAPALILRTMFLSLARAQTRDYRGPLATACQAYSARTTGAGALVLYDVRRCTSRTTTRTTCARSPCPRSTAWTLRSRSACSSIPVGSPWRCTCSRATRPRRPPSSPVLNAFQTRHGVTGMVVVADTGTLSASNLAEHFERHGSYFTDGQIQESSRAMGPGTGTDARPRRVVYQWRFKREQHHDNAINVLIERAEGIADGCAPLKKARFLKGTGATTALDHATISRPRPLAGLKGDVTNLPIETRDGAVASLRAGSALRTRGTTIDPEAAG
jgi:hypothetical protein